MRIVLLDARAPLAPLARERLLLRLPPVERDRVARFRRWEDAQASLVGHGVMLDLVSAALPAPGEVALVRGDRDRPFIARPADCGLDVNMSHSGGYVAGALCAGARIGVDVECARKVYPGVAERCFGPEELAWLGPPDAEGHAERFFRLWTLKESLVKARGDGITSDLKAIRFDVREDAIHVTVRGEPLRWRSVSWHPAPGVFLAVTTDSPEPIPGFEWLPAPR